MFHSFGLLKTKPVKNVNFISSKDKVTKTVDETFKDIAMPFFILSLLPFTAGGMGEASCVCVVLINQIWTHTHTRCSEVVFRWTNEIRDTERWRLTV